MRHKYYIVNHVDRPNERHVAQVRGRESDQLEYIHGDLDTWPRMEKTDRATPVEDFGIRVIDTANPPGKVTFIKERESKAKYPDGRRREWQGATHFHLTPIKTNTF